MNVLERFLIFLKSRLKMPPGSDPFMAQFEKLSAAIKDKQVTYDLARLMEPKVEPVSCSGFAEAIIERF